jgi:endonuclease/exonuclease/phosphatase family metal-dependent hydrolase
VSLSLASLNLHCGLDHEGTPYSVKAAVAALDSDIVVVQENWRPSGQDSLARQAAADCGYPAYAEIDVITGHSLPELGVAGTGLNGTGLNGTGLNGTGLRDETGAWGLAVMSRIPWRGLSTMSLGAARGDVVGTRRALIADVPVAEGRLLRVVNVHLTHRLAHGPAQLRRLLAGLRGTATPTVIAGDLNMCRPTVFLAGPYRPAVRGRTWPAYRPIAQIDHVLAGPGVQILASGVAPPTGSDHLPVRVTLGLTAPLRLTAPVRLTAPLRQASDHPRQESDDAGSTEAATAKLTQSSASSRSRDVAGTSTPCGAAARRPTSGDGSGCAGVSAPGPPRSVG